MKKVLAIVVVPFLLAGCEIEEWEGQYTIRDGSQSWTRTVTAFYEDDCNNKLLAEKRKAEEKYNALGQSVSIERYCYIGDSIGI